ncbi:GtrA family protein [Halobacillus shinanisalinarum]|uniref:GtrA family protein n=1 Tax=Halobacillus shinanisalinarum TaxID=2932258 RepID=A0ABY4GZX0_9BACI|nr:GtrA family protein [Halobacillus shinanisalinarum]UOQ93634.1 GtrA family protein [Halobacillus shinanisalinarum]
MEKAMQVINREFIRFIVVGIINTLNYYMVYLLLHVMIEIDYMTAHIGSSLISLVISFFLNSYYTFKVRPTLSKFLQFPLTQLFNIAVSSFFVYLFVENLRINSTIAPVLSIFITVPLTFIITGKILKNNGDFI